MSITYGKAQHTDFDRLNALFTEMLQTIYHTDQVRGYAPGDMDRFFSGGEEWVCTAADHGTIIGFVSIEVHREGPVYLYLDDLAVTEAYRSKGIGTALIGHAEAYAQQIHVTAVYLHVEKSNASALRLYQRLGYRIAEEQASRYLMAKAI